MSWRENKPFVTKPGVGLTERQVERQIDAIFMTLRTL
jgi:hypothetical protein